MHFCIFLALKMRLVVTILAAFVWTKMSVFRCFLSVFEDLLYAYQCSTEFRMSTTQGVWPWTQGYWPFQWWRGGVSHKIRMLNPQLETRATYIAVFPLGHFYDMFIACHHVFWFVASVCVTFHCVWFGDWSLDGACVLLLLSNFIHFF